MSIQTVRLDLNRMPKEHSKIGKRSSATQAAGRSSLSWREDHGSV